MQFRKHPPALCPDRQTHTAGSQKACQGHVSQGVQGGRKTSPLWLLQAENNWLLEVGPPGNRLYTLGLSMLTDLVGICKPEPWRALNRRGILTGLAPQGGLTLRPTARTGEKTGGNTGRTGLHLQRALAGSNTTKAGAGWNRAAVKFTILCNLFCFVDYILTKYDLSMEKDPRRPGRW